MGVHRTCGEANGIDPTATTHRNWTVLYLVLCERHLAILSSCQANPVCKYNCARFTAGMCKLATATRNTAVCTVPKKTHEVQWYNPAVSLKEYV